MLVALLAARAPAVEAWAAKAEPLFENYCIDCHDADAKKGNLDLTALQPNLDDPKTFATWVKVHDRVQAGEMPPKKKAQPGWWTKSGFVKSLDKALTATEAAREKDQGRSTWRRMNRYEYENTLRDLLGAPWLQIKDKLPEDGEAYRFNKVGDALDVSHVQMGRYLGVADYALREVVAAAAAPIPTATNRWYARDQGSFANKVKFSEFNRSPERATFPITGTTADLAALSDAGPMTVGPSNPAIRAIEAMGMVASSYEPIEPKFNKFTAPASGLYKLRMSALTFWAAPDTPKQWWRPSRTNITAGRTTEPVTLYAESPPRQLRRLGSFDVGPGPTTNELTVYLLKGETIRPDPVRLFRSRPGKTAWHNPLATTNGQPGVAFRWLETEGPILESPTRGAYRLLFGDLPAKRDGKGRVTVVSKEPRADAERLLRGFMARAYRRPVLEEDVQRFLKVADAALAGSDFDDAMLTVYSAVLCSPAFVTLEEKPGRLDDHALAARLSYFLWNSEPDAELRALAANGELSRARTLRAQAGRLLADPRSRRFVDAFLDYWLELRKAEATSPDSDLYPDYYLDDHLVESAVEESQLFFAELLRGNLPARHIVSSDFAFLNARLAAHYGLPPVEGVTLRRVGLPAGSVRGGFLTQASVLKVTANGTTTSPVLRGAWINERMLGLPVPPPPASVPAIEPDTRGATTIRQQLEKHREQASCNACHAKIDPPGFALESFDVLGGWRTNYRALGEGMPPPGYGKNGQPFAFHAALPVDASGNLPDGRAFRDVSEFKQLLLKDERQIARNLAGKLVTYATGAPVRYSDRDAVEDILDDAAKTYGVRSLVLAVIESDLFRSK